jgi:pimeloyl-ACP methyl ester carboxylesterase
MSRIPAVALVAFTLAACAKKEEAPQAGGAGTQTTQVTPLSHAQAQANIAAIRFGHAFAPDETVPAAGTDCASFVSQYPGYVAGSLEVPEDWSNPDKSPKISLFYYWKKGEGDAANRPPVVFFNGGPASDSHSSVEVLSTQDFLNNSSFVFLDQRGTGCSTNFPTEMTEENAQRLTKWGSRAIVADSEALRKHLFGDRKWRPYGQSYGGFIVHRYLETAPQGIDRAIAHGASIMQDPVDWQVERVKSQKRVSDTYFQQYPDDKTIMTMARATLSPKQCWKNGNDGICGPSVFDSLTILLGFHDSWPQLHQWIQKLRGSDGKLNIAYVNKVVTTFVFGVYGEGGLAGDVISKMEIVPGFDDRTGCGETMDRLTKAGDKPESWLINECRLLIDYQKPNFAVMKNVKGAGIDLQALRANIENQHLPFFLYSGQQDVFVPYATFNEEVKFLGNDVHYESFPNSGHEGFYTEPHVIDAVTGANQ